MHTSFHVEPMNHGQACQILEALCEGYVLAMMVEFDAYPEGEFPCCIKCGGFRTRDAPLAPVQAESLYETLEHGHPVSGLQRHAIAEILESNGYEVPPLFEAESSNPSTVRVRSAREILESRGGSTVELASYQCAMKRREGADPGAKVIICCVEPGTFRGAVLMSEHHSNPEKRGRIDDPVVDARPVGGCGCEVGQ